MVCSVTFDHHTFKCGLTDLFLHASDAPFLLKGLELTFLLGQTTHDLGDLTLV